MIPIIHTKKIYVNGEPFDFILKWFLANDGGGGGSVGLTKKSYTKWRGMFPDETDEEYSSFWSNFEKCIPEIDEGIDITFNKNIPFEQKEKAIETWWQKIKNKHLEIVK